MSTLAQRIQELVEPLDRSGQPGGVIAVARNGIVEECVSYGYANLEHGIRNSRETVFYIASTSKQFVAASIALLEIDGILGADDPIAKYVPEVEHLGDIRVHHLIHHTSGIRDKYGLAMIGRLPDLFMATDDGSMDLLARQNSLNFPPGSRFMYSNSGYYLMAKIVERCTGQDFADFTDERLFRPMGMSDTRFRADTNDVIPGRASGYAANADGTWKQAEYTMSALGPGGVVTNVDSLAKWGRVYTDEALAGLAPHLMITRPLRDGRPNNYAYGIKVDELDGVGIIEHAGGVQGFSAQMIQVPSAALTIVSLANCAKVDAPMLASKVVALALDGTPATSVAPTSDDHAVPTRNPRVGSYVDGDEATIIAVERTDDGEHALSFYGNSLPMRFRHDDVWSVESGEVTFDADGLSLRLGDTAIDFRPIEISSEGRLPDSLVGRYISPELGVTLTISRADEGLQVAWPLGAAKPLSSAGEDFLVVTVDEFPMLIRILRTGSDVTGLRISVGRALGTEFVREN